MRNQLSKKMSTISHVSHCHPLELTNLQRGVHMINGNSPPPCCSGCKRSLSPPNDSYAYCCLSCNYFLHRQCSEMPAEIRHPADKDHPLSLCAVAPYPGGVFKCSACGEPGSGFLYACTICNLDLHIGCANMPVHLRHHKHKHTLELSVLVARGGLGFICHVCGKFGRKSWRYRCKTCVFDAHPGCVLEKYSSGELTAMAPGPSERSPQEEKTERKTSVKRQIGERIAEAAAVSIVSGVVGSMFL